MGVAQGHIAPPLAPPFSKNKTSAPPPPPPPLPPSSSLPLPPPPPPLPSSSCSHQQDKQAFSCGPRSHPLTPFLLPPHHAPSASRRSLVPSPPLPDEGQWLPSTGVCTVIKEARASQAVKVAAIKVITASAQLVMSETKNATQQHQPINLVSAARKQMRWHSF